ncbi:hypothetical protein BDV97DRAFT_412459 [Delphinella strobiligena]|nr:hypothetical protein BDV97DRAFT_412459 [Delphinella strobiligena]
MRFLATGTGRVVRMQTSVEDELTGITTKIRVDDVRNKFGIARSRSTSPKKRKEVTSTDEPSDAELRSLHWAKRRRKLSAVASNMPCRKAASGSPPECQSLKNISPKTPPPACPTQSRFNHKAEHCIQEMEQLKRASLLSQRPANLSLYCCDYPAAEAAVKAGISGKKSGEVAIYARNA